MSLSGSFPAGRDFRQASRWEAYPHNTYQDDLSTHDDNGVVEELFSGTREAKIVESVVVVTNGRHIVIQRGVPNSML